MPHRRDGDPPNIDACVLDDGRLYLAADDAARFLRVRAALYRDRAEHLTRTAALGPEDPLDPFGRIEEALGDRLVAEELEQRADALEALEATYLDTDAVPPAAGADRRRRADPPPPLPPPAVAMLWAGIAVGLSVFPLGSALLEVLR